MNPASYSFTAYRKKLKMTRNRVLLVEGRDDKRAFKDLIHAIGPRDSESTPGVDIDTAEFLQSPSGRSLGNGEKIEELCAELKGEDIADKFVGFVDRQFRKFYLDGDGPMEDLVGGHFVWERLVWSRGHSIENYFFDLDILNEAFAVFSLSESSQHALEMFRRLFDSSLRLACATSLAGNDTGFLNLVKKSIDWTIIRLAGDSVTIDVAQWKDKLKKHLKATTAIADQIIDRYSYWHPRVAISRPETVRWLCHGHVGLRMLWAVYARCVYEASGQTECEAARVLGVEERVRFNACVKFWVQRTSGGAVPYPSTVLRMLGVEPLHASATERS